MLIPIPPDIFSGHPVPFQTIQNPHLTYKIFLYKIKQRNRHAFIRPKVFLKNGYTPKLSGSFFKYAHRGALMVGWISSKQ